MASAVREAGGVQPAAVAAICLAPLDREAPERLGYLKWHSRIDRKCSPPSWHDQVAPSTAPGRWYFPEPGKKLPGLSPGPSQAGEEAAGPSRRFGFCPFPVKVHIFVLSLYTYNFLF